MAKPSPGMRSRSRPKLGTQPLRHRTIDLDRFQQLLLLHVLSLRVRHLNRAWSEQQRLAPIRYRRDIGRESCDHRWQTVQRPQPEERSLACEANLGQLADGRRNLAAQHIRRAHQAIEKVSLGKIGNYVWSAPPLNCSDVLCASAHLGIFGK